MPAASHSRPVHATARLSNQRLASFVGHRTWSEPAAESAATDDEKPKARKPKAAKTDDAEADA